MTRHDDRPAPAGPQPTDRPGGVGCDAAPSWRPATASDVAGLADLIERASSGARRHRFHAALRRAPAGWAESMARLPRREGVMLVAAESGRPGASLVAEAGYRIEPDRRSATFALLVDDRWQRRGLGSWAMCALLQFAAVDGLRWLHGDVLTGNAAMAGLMTQQGYRWVAQDREVMRAERDVPVVAADRDGSWDTAPLAVSAAAWTRVRA
jgi:GNAT superfamily N-acetyltransferase